MNGRCETDPFEKAVDVCGMCYGDFCASCLVTLKRRKYPLCKECVVLASGIRGGGKPKRRGDKKTAKLRREYFQNSGPGDEIIRYFDEDLDPSDLLPPEAIAPAPVPAPEPSKKRSSRKKKAKTRPAKPTASTLPVAPITAVEEDIPQSAIDQLHQLRQDQEGGSPESSSTVAPPPSPTPQATPDIPATAEPADAKLDSVPSPQTEPEPIAEVEPMPQPRPKPPPRPKGDKASGPKLGDLIQPKVRPAPPKPATKSTGAEKKPETTAVADPSKPPEWPGTPLPADNPHVPAARVVESPFGEPTPSSDPEGGIADPFGSKPVPATVGSSAPLQATASEHGETGSSDTGSSDTGSSDTGSSDTDDRGEWVPPVLRGMAPDAAEAKASLPSRRRSDS